MPLLHVFITAQDLRLALTAGSDTVVGLISGLPCPQPVQSWADIYQKTKSRVQSFEMAAKEIKNLGSTHETESDTALPCSNFHFHTKTNHNL